MTKLKLRGQEVSVEGNRIFLTIKKPLDDKFSINDKLYDLINQDKQLVVTIEKRKDIYITKKTPVLFKEEVKSKFSNCSSWYRYWYKYGCNNQFLLF
jgi:hypothetical protein